MYKSVIVIDDFYPDPHKLRETALALDYPPPVPGQTFPGRNSATRLLIDGMDRIVSQIVNEPMRGNLRNAHGRFRMTLASDPAGRFNIHIDEDTVWAGIAYLTLPEQCQGGSVFYRHIPTGTDRAPILPGDLAAFGADTPEDAVAKVLDPDSSDPSKWETIMTVPMRFNRLALFRPWFWHAGTEAFGDDPENGRLIQVLFFTHDERAAQQPRRPAPPSAKATVPLPI